jgi:hypothetical protein
MSAIILTIGAITAGVGAVASGTAAGINASKNKKAARLEAAKQRRMEKRLEQLEQTRQPVINQAAKIREMKDQVFNPYANLGVAMKATELQIAETDKALANTLDAIQAQGPGAGSATALAQMAASGKAQVSAQIENQEASNMQLRIEGESAKQQQLMQLEQTALAEEVAAFDRQEERDIAQMSRVAGLADRAGAQSIAYGQAAQQNTMDALGAVTDLGTSMMTIGSLQGGGPMDFAKSGNTATGQLSKADWTSLNKGVQGAGTYAQYIKQFQ